MFVAEESDLSGLLLERFSNLGMTVIFQGLLGHLGEGSEEEMDKVFR